MRDVVGERTNSDVIGTVTTVRGGQIAGELRRWSAALDRDVTLGRSARISFLDGDDFDETVGTRSENVAASSIAALSGK